MTRSPRARDLSRKWQATI